MAKAREINIALLGCGKLGQGLYILWSKKRDNLLEQTGIDLKITHILVKHINYKRNELIPSKLITDNVNKILKDTSVQIVIDAMGGIEPTFGIIKQFLNRGCHIVSANRALLASKMREFFELARSKKVQLQFDAALGGGIPIVRLIKQDLIASQITGMWGIASGTANYILTEMHRSKMSLKEVIKLPQLRSLTESHLLVDYEGSDSAQKLSLLAAMAFGKEINYLQVYAEGITDLKQADIQFAEEFGYKFKLLTILKDKKEGLELRVHPTLVPNDHPLNSVQYDYNAVYIQTDLVGEFMLYGKGAGIFPASNMIIRDLVEIATSIKASSRYIYEYPLWNDKKIIPIEEIRSGYYIRLICLDVPGVMGKIATVLGENSINIESAHASGRRRAKETKTAFVHIFVESAIEKDIRKAISLIKKLKIIKGESKVFRILGETRNVDRKIEV
jgi:homoserine dehydrogenase